MAGLLTAVDTDRDEHLLSRHLSGDVAAFGDLYALHYDRLLRHVRRRVRDWHLAEEIVQDTFVRAYEASAHLNDPRRFYPWLTVIANRLAIDAFRRAGRVSPVAALDPKMGHEPAADERLIAACEAEAIEAAMGRVRERHRQVLAWQNQGVSYEGIAQRLDAPLTTVPPLLFRARQALKREYLAVVEAEGRTAVPMVGAMAAWFRRWRLRGNQFASHFPEPAVFTAQVCTAAVVIGTAIVGPVGDPRGMGVMGVGPASPEMASHMESADSGSVAALDGIPQNIYAAGTSESDEGPVLVDGNGVAAAGVGGAGRHRAQRQVQEAPYSVQYGPIGVGLDPQGDAERLRELMHDDGTVYP
ncbi:MAG TPA: RNA polymerase sigma factor [Pilimelia sp.]|nr:RNA polymerase sigma factor [Pilimelia sp.]